MKACILIVVISVVQVVHAQELYSKYGEVPMEDLKMKTYLPDTTTDAVVLFDHAEIEASPTFGTTLVRHLRIRFSEKKHLRSGEIFRSSRSEASSPNLEEEIALKQGHLLLRRQCCCEARRMISRHQEKNVL